MNETPNANRVTAAGLGVAVATILAWVLEEFFAVVPPGPVTAAGAVVIGAIVQAIYSLFPGVGSADKQAGFARPALLLGMLLAALLATTLVGCASSPHRAPQTVYESLLVSNAYGEQVTHTVNDLRRLQVITSEQHQEALDHLQRALDASRAARAAYQASQWQEAQSGLDRTEAALRAVAYLLAPFMPDDPGNQAFILRYAGGNP